MKNLMKTPMNNTKPILVWTLVAGVAIFAAGCDSKPKEPTPGERLDNAIADVKQSASEAGDKMEQKADQMGQAIDDTAITTSVKTKLLAADNLKGLDIKVETVKGVVTLTGKVANAAAKELAVTLTQSVDGVVSVNDELVIQ